MSRSTNRASTSEPGATPADCIVDVLWHLAHARIIAVKHAIPGDATAPWAHLANVLQAVHDAAWANDEEALRLAARWAKRYYLDGSKRRGSAKHPVWPAQTSQEMARVMRAHLVAGGASLSRWGAAVLLGRELAGQGELGGDEAVIEQLAQTIYSAMPLRGGRARDVSGSHRRERFEEDPSRTVIAALIACDPPRRERYMQIFAAEKMRKHRKGRVTKKGVTGI